VAGRLPQVRFSIAQSAARNAGGSYELEAIPVEVPTWWDAVQRGFAQPGESATERQWAHGNFMLVGREAAQGQARVSFVLQDDAGSEWRLGSVPSPVHRVMWLGDSLPAGTREALMRSFNASAVLGGGVHIAGGTTRAPKGHVAGRANGTRRPVVQRVSMTDPPDHSR
jgi:hypothetical protein